MAGADAKIESLPISGVGLCLLSLSPSTSADVILDEDGAWGRVMPSAQSLSLDSCQLVHKLSHN